MPPKPDESKKAPPPAALTKQFATMELERAMEQDGTQRHLVPKRPAGKAVEPDEAVVFKRPFLLQPRQPTTPERVVMPSAALKRPAEDILTPENPGLSALEKMGAVKMSLPQLPIGRQEATIISAALPPRPPRLIRRNAMTWSSSANPGYVVRTRPDGPTKRKDRDSGGEGPSSGHSGR